MAVYYVNSYDIDNPEEFQKYPPLAIALIEKYGGEVLASDTEGIAIEGNPRLMNAVVRFPSKERAIACYNDPEYQAAKQIRHNSTSNATMVLVKEFEPAS